MKKLLTTCALLATLSASQAVAETIKVDVWADNWFSFYSGETAIAEDSISITTERSFNAESFSFEASRPFVLNFVVKEFKENDSGLEYIGSGRQQMGDGGFIAQFKDSSNNLIAATDNGWRCMVTHDGPADKSCASEKNPVAGSGKCAFTTTAEPEGWMKAGFDDSAWAQANEYSQADVRPKDGYDRISWDTRAKLIWGPDLETNNTLLCRKIIN
jgi:hypothetical protein